MEEDELTEDEQKTLFTVTTNFSYDARFRFLLGVLVLAYAGASIHGKVKEFGLRVLDAMGTFIKEDLINEETELPSQKED